MHIFDKRTLMYRFSRIPQVYKINTIHKTSRLQRILEQWKNKTSVDLYDRTQLIRFVIETIVVIVTFDTFTKSPIFKASNIILWIDAKYVDIQSDLMRKSSQKNRYIRYDRYNVLLFNL